MSRSVGFEWRVGENGMARQPGVVHWVVRDTELFPLGHVNDRSMNDDESKNQALALRFHDSKRYTKSSPAATAKQTQPTANSMYTGKLHFVNAALNMVV